MKRIVPSESSTVSRMRSPTRSLTRCGRRGSAIGKCDELRRAQLEGPNRRTVRRSGARWIDALDVLNECGPILESVFPREDELCVGECELRAVVARSRYDGTRTCDGVGVAGAVVTKQVLCLFAELFQRWTRWQPRGGFGHDDLLSRAARVRTPG